MNKKRNLNDFLQDVLGNAVGQLLYDFIKQWLIWLPGFVAAALYKFLVADQTIAAFLLLASFIIPIMLITYSYAKPRFTLTRKQQPAPVVSIGK